MINLKILNSKEIRQIKKSIVDQWGVEYNEDVAFLMNNTNDVFIISKSIGDIDYSKLNINAAGLYFGEFKGGVLRLSIEGSQIIGPNATKNVLDFNGTQIEQWVTGNNIDWSEEIDSFVIIKHGLDYFGCGRIKNGQVLNFVPKSRRVKTLSE